MPKSKDDVVINLKKHRLLAGLTQAELAEKLGVDPHSVQNWEVGRRSPNLKTIQAIAKALKCTFFDLTGINGHKDKPETAALNSLVARIEALEEKQSNIPDKLLKALLNASDDQIRAIELILNVEKDK